MYIPFLKKEPVILDLTRIALEDNESAREPCLFTFGPGLWRSETEEDFPSQVLADKKLPSRLSEGGVIFNFITKRFTLCIPLKPAAGRYISCMLIKTYKRSGTMILFVCLFVCVFWEENTT